MSIKLTSQQGHFRVEDESGYSFEIHTHYTESGGWSAHLEIGCSGRANEAACVAKLLESAKEFVRMATVK